MNTNGDRISPDAKVCGQESGPERRDVGKFIHSKKDKRCEIEIKMKKLAELIQKKKIATKVDVEWSRHDEWKMIKMHWNCNENS